MFVRMPGLSPVPELATFLFQLCKRSGGTSLTKAGKILAKRSFCHTDLKYGIYKGNYLWSCATNLLHDSSAVSLPTSPPLKIRDHLETFLFFSHERAVCIPHCETSGASGCLSRATALMAEKNSQTSSLQIRNTCEYEEKEMNWEMNNFLLISLGIYRNHLMKGVVMQWPVHQW